MTHRSKWQWISIGVLGVAMALTPVSVAAAGSHKPKHPSSSHVNGSAPGSAMCKDVKNEQAGANSAGTSIEKAIESGNFATAKQAMLNSYNTDLGNVQKALSVIKSAPANVQAAFKGLLTFVQKIKSDIQNAVERAGVDHVVLEPGPEPPAPDRFHHHRQLVHVRVRRRPRHHNDGELATPFRRGSVGA